MTPLEFVAALLLAGPGDALGPREREFLTRHCSDCHDRDTRKGGLDLTALTGDMATRPLADQWTRILDRVHAGEMPPPKIQPRPDAEALMGLIDWIRPRLNAADQARREVVHRRLNRTEYEHTVRDLLAVDLDLQKFLPPDQRAGGFDNNGEALALSAELMAAYLEAAGAALDAALVRGPRPPTVTFTTDSLKEVGIYLPQKLYGHTDGRVFTYLSDESRYSKISSRDRRVPVRGRYRVRFEAVTCNAPEPLTFSVTASDFAPISATFKPLGFFEAGPSPRTFEIETVLDAREAVQFFAHGLPAWVNRPAEGRHPGIGFGPVTITGPLFERWPPESHARLLGEVGPERGRPEDVEPILRRFMPLAFRRPVAEDELDRVRGLVDARLKAGRRFEEALRAGLIAVLCSPDFLYLREEARASQAPVSDLELASRLSYFLWSSLPDAELLDLAERNRLREPGTLRSQALRLLAHPRSSRFVENFTGQWLRLRDIEATTPDRKLYKDFDEVLQASMLLESSAFFREILERDLNLDHFLDSDFAMLNRRLARHYGIEGVEGFEIRAVRLPPGSLRGGVLTQGAVLKVTANGTNTSPVHRGLWVLENIFGRSVPPPPPNTPGIEPDIRGAVTLREQLDKHRSVESCSTCHRHIDPPGFALESFDPVGRFRRNYLRWVPHPQNPEWGHVAEGAPVDASGRTPGNQDFADFTQFKKILLEQRADFARCLAGKLLTYALGRELGFSDRDAVAAIVSRTAASGNGLRTLLLEIAGSPLFRRR